MNTVNIVMATYNGEKYLAEQIESILNSTYTDWSLFLCDDGSTDQTLAIAAQYEAKYPERIHIIKNERNLGVTKNFLVNLKKLKQESELIEGGFSKISSNVAKYYMFADQDDVWFPEKIEMTIARMEKMERKYGKDKPLLVFSDTTVVDEGLKQLHPSFYFVQCYNLYHMDLGHMMMENKCIGCTIMVNESLVKKLNTIPEHARYHDWWAALIASAFGKISFIGQPLMYYRQHSSNEVGTMTYGNYFMRRIKNLKAQREAIKATVEQAKDFYEIYGPELSDRERRRVYQFSTLYEHNWFARRRILLRTHTLKSGLLRNLGLFLIA
ncbi:MAG: glycosyltransferase family 2 protein [Lachnospiraceae bacterium]|nr:glycosyltransferase family 2 protein [Lachnospiraceae bacterium]